MSIIYLLLTSIIIFERAIVIQLASAMNDPVDNLLRHWQQEKTIAGNITDWHVLAEFPAQCKEIPPDLHPILKNALLNSNITSLYTHQIKSWEEVKDGKNIVVSTGTASGKTLCYFLPVLNNYLCKPKSTALFLFPTKALTYDQKNQLVTFVKWMNHPDLSGVGIAVYDGDTPSQQRSLIRRSARILLTNPDMLHLGILPHHTNWAEFFKNLQFIVIDELHVYRGVFGSHIANLIRRLLRVAHFYGSYPQFILASATISNPVQLAERLTESKITLIDQDGSPHGKRTFILYNPPIIQPELGIRRSVTAESVRLTEDLLTYQIQSLLFARSRRMVEIILKELQSKTLNDPSKLHGYRSGYLPMERRSIEQGMRSGEAKAVVATNALELGIDIGGMDAVLLVGYPGSIAATRQQSGRAGRRNKSSLAILVASSSPIDQFLIKHPEFLFDRSPEQALIDPDNLLILLHHIQCAAFELPFRKGEGFGNIPPSLFSELMEILEQSGVVNASGDRYFWTADMYPANNISLRSISGQPILLQSEIDDHAKIIGEVDLESASWMVHPGAIYMHEGKTYEVKDLSFEDNKALLSPVNVDYFTEPLKKVEIEKIQTLRYKEVLGGSKYYGEIKVTSQVTGYRVILWQTREILEQRPLEMPPSQMRTMAFWLSLTPETVETLRNQGLWNNERNDYGANWNRQRLLARERDHFTCQSCGIVETSQAHHVHHKVPFRNFISYIQANRLENLITLCPACHVRAETVIRMRSGLAGFGYVLQQIAPLFLMCDSSDLGSFSDPESKISENLPLVMIYDEIPAGIGLSENLYEQYDRLIVQCFNLVQECECSDGCPSCVGPAGEGGIGGKLETLAILKLLLANHN